MNGEEGRIDPADDARDRRALVAGTVMIVATTLLLGMVHSAFVSETIDGPAQPSPALRIPGSIVMTVSMALFIVMLGVHRATGVWRALRLIVPAAAAAGFARAALFWATGAWSGEVTGLWLADWLGGMSTCVCAAILGFFYLRSQRALRLEERISGERATQRELALRTLETEEVRVRRSIAEGLHGSLQQRLVVQSIRLSIMIERADERDVDDEILDGMRTLLEEIDLIRENDVREMSRMLYPESIEIGMVPAIRAILRRLPPSIATKLDASDAARDIDDPTCSLMSQAARLLAVRFVEESVTNGLRHGHATAFAVAVDFVDGVLVLDATNDGAVMDLVTLEDGSGLRRLRERFELVGGRIDVMLDVGQEPAGLAPAGSDHSVWLRALLPLGAPTEDAPASVTVQAKG